MDQALKQHTDGTSVVIPIILRPVYWEKTPFSILQALPTNAKPITIWGNRDEAFVNVTIGILTVVKELRRQEEDNSLKDGGTFEKEISPNDESYQSTEESSWSYASTLERVAEWARQRAKEGDDKWINAVVAADRLIVPLRRGLKKFFGANDLSRVTVVRTEEISLDDLPEDIRQEFCKRKRRDP
jgi:hypothetical protein